MGTNLLFCSSFVSQQHELQPAAASGGGGGAAIGGGRRDGVGGEC